jgi:hypothetical protein
VREFCEILGRDLAHLFADHLVEFCPQFCYMVWVAEEFEGAICQGCCRGVAVRNVRSLLLT